MIQTKTSNFDLYNLIFTNQIIIKAHSITNIGILARINIHNTTVLTLDIVLSHNRIIIHVHSE